MKLRDFLKQFENEDLDTEIVQQTKDHYRDLEKDIDIVYFFVSPDEFQKEVIVERTCKRHNSEQIRVIQIG